MTDTDESRIRQIVEQKAAAMGAQDAEGMVAHHAPEVVQFSLAPPLRQASADARSAQGTHKWLDGLQGKVSLEIRDLDITVGGDVAFCHSLNHMVAEGGVQDFSLWFRSTLGLTKVDGTWLITHEHQSTPFDMDGSFRASVTLEP
jgi:ketosteroid isomerase-like protein